LNAIARERPVAQYRREFLALVQSVAPASVLDVGCGDGEFLAQLAPSVARVAGVDTDAEELAQAAARGLAVSNAPASKLPFADGEFDWVTLQYTAHHVPDLPSAMAECWRVSRVGVLVLDPWYDESIVSQRIAAALDRWHKQVDRHGGMIHNDCLSAFEIAGAFASRPDVRFELWYRLIVSLRDFADIVREVDARLRTGIPKPLEAEVRAIVEDAERHGLSDDGAVFVRLTRVGVDPA
jgi:SAM-dependent methyltransferase